MKIRWIAMLVVGCSCGVAAGGHWTVAGLTDEATSKLEARVGYQFDPLWELGGLATWFAKDQSVPWGAGAYGKLTVDPNTKVPVANWLPWLGKLLGLPETMQASQYLVAKCQVLPYDNAKPDLALGVGPGIRIGPATVEFIYAVIESGGSARPDLSSGFEVWLGVTLPY